MVWVFLLGIGFLYLALLQLLREHAQAYLEKSEPFLWGMNVLQRHPRGEYDFSYPKLFRNLFISLMMGALILTLHGVYFPMLSFGGSIALSPGVIRWWNNSYITLQVSYFSLVLLLGSRWIQPASKQKLKFPPKGRFIRLFWISCAASLLVVNYMTGLWSHYNSYYFIGFNSKWFLILWAFFSTALAFYLAFFLFLLMVSGKALAFLYSAFRPFFRGLTSFVLALLFSWPILAGKNLEKQPLSARKIRKWVLYQCFLLGAFTAGVALAGIFWFFTGQKTLERAKKDILEAAYNYTLPNQPPVSDPENAVYYFKQAYQAFLSTPFYYTPQKGFPPEPVFYQKLTESAFLGQTLLDAQKRIYPVWNWLRRRFS